MANRTNETNTKKILLKLDIELHKKLKINAVKQNTTLHNYLVQILTKI